MNLITMNKILVDSKKLVFATNNSHKLEEVRSLLPKHISILSLNDIGFNDDIPETESTLEGNAVLKAKTINNRFGMNCFADDTGLEVIALDGKPGVHSARYAGLPANPAENTSKLLHELHNIADRRARFRTVIALILDSNIYYFEGTVNGKITDYPRGTQGFGYDPVFIPDGFNCTFAEMNMAEKNAISHRAQAINILVQFLMKTS